MNPNTSRDKQEKQPLVMGDYYHQLQSHPSSSSASGLLLSSSGYLSPGALQNVSNGFHHPSGIITMPKPQQQEYPFQLRPAQNFPSIQHNVSVYTTPMVHQFSQDPGSTGYSLLNSAPVPTSNYGYNNEVYPDSNNFQHPMDVIEEAANPNIYNYRKFFDTQPSDDTISGSNEMEKITFYPGDNDEVVLNLSKQVPQPQQHLISSPFQTSVPSSNSAHFDDNLSLQQTSVIRHTGDVPLKSTGAENSQELGHHLNPNVGNKGIEYNSFQVLPSPSIKKGSRVVSVGGRVIINKNENILNMGQNHQQQFECIMNEIQSNQSGECAVNYANVDSNDHWNNGASEQQTSLEQNCHPFTGSSSMQTFSAPIDLNVRYLETSPAMYSNNVCETASDNMEANYNVGENLQAMTSEPQQFTSFPPPRKPRKPRGSNPSRPRNTTPGRGRGRKQPSIPPLVLPSPALENGIVHIGVHSIESLTSIPDSYATFENANSNLPAAPTQLKSGRGRGKKKQTIGDRATINAFAVASQLVIPSPSPSFSINVGEIMYQTPENSSVPTPEITQGKKSSGSRKRSKSTAELNSCNSTEKMAKGRSAKKKQVRKSVEGSDTVELGIDPKVSARVMSEDKLISPHSPDITDFNSEEASTPSSGRGRGRGGRGRGRGRGGKVVGDGTPRKPGKKRASKQGVPVEDLNMPTQREPKESFQDIIAKKLNFSGNVNHQQQRQVSTNESSSGDGHFPLPANNESVDFSGMELLSQCVSDIQSKQLTSCFDPLQMTDQAGLCIEPIFDQSFDIQSDETTRNIIEDIKPAIAVDSVEFCDDGSTRSLPGCQNQEIVDFMSVNHDASVDGKEVPAAVAPHDNGDNIVNFMEQISDKSTTDGVFNGNEEAQSCKGKRRRSMKTTKGLEEVGKSDVTTKRKSRNVTTAKRRSTKKGDLNVESSACPEKGMSKPVDTLQDVKLDIRMLAENVSELVAVKLEVDEEKQTIEMDIKTEIAEEKKSEGSTSQTKVNKRNMLKRPVNRNLKKPKIPMRESFSSNLVRKVGKRAKGKKTLKRELIENEITKEPVNRMLKVKTITSKYTMPIYSDQEKETLYGNGRFVIDVNDIDKEPDNVFIWQIITEESCLRQYFPSKYGLKQFFISSPVKWYFYEEEFKSETFYARFQPIVVVLANSHTKGEPLKTLRTTDMSDAVVQYIHIDKPFFCRVCKYIGKIGETEGLRKDFMASFPVYTLLTLYPTFIRDNLNSNELGPLDQEMLKAWTSLGSFLDHIFRLSEEKRVFTEDTFERLFRYPSLTCSLKDVNKDVNCSACYQKARVPNVKVSFSPKENMKPYDHTTLEEFVQNPDNLDEAQTFYWCRGCSTSAKKLHRLIHFRYNLLSLTRQNVAKDIENFQRLKTPVTEDVLLWTQSQAISWKNVMFLDFQVCVAELEDEFLT